MTIEYLLDRQREFQKLCGFNFDTLSNEDKNRMAEIYLFKAIEELIELRKTFPSSLNSHSKNQINDNKGTYNELCDVLLFLMNFVIAKDMDVNNLFIWLEEVQKHNFQSLYERKALNSAKQL